MRREAEQAEAEKKQELEELQRQNIARAREIEREKRERELSSVIKQPMNMMDQFEIMKKFQQESMK